MRIISFSRDYAIGVAQFLPLLTLPVILAIDDAVRYEHIAYAAEESET